jgi:acetolactate synthase-1/3 small subunit
MTIVARGDDAAVDQFKNQLSKLIDVVTVVELDNTSVRRELALLKVSAGLEHRVHIMVMANVFRARIVDISPESMTMEVTGAPEKIDGLIDMVRPFGIIETVRTGLVAMARGPAPLAAAPLAAAGPAGK